MSNPFSIPGTWTQNADGSVTVSVNGSSFTIPAPVVTPPPPTPPAPPTGLTLTLGGTTISPTVAAAWSASAGATSYDLTRNGAVAFPGVTGLSVVDSGVSPGTTDVYSVVARNAAGASAPSATQSITLTGVGVGSGPPINSQSDVSSSILKYSGGVSSSRILLPINATWSNGRVTGTGISTGFQQGALMLDNNCTLIDCTVDNVPNAFAAVYRSNDSATVTITGGRFTGAGCLGIGSGGGAWNITGAETDHNGVHAHGGPWGDQSNNEAGGWKGVGKVNLVACKIHDNASIGAWWDINGSGSCVNCDINDNEFGGVQFEISEGFVVDTCRLKGNGWLNNGGWYWNGAIGIYASFNVEIKGCTIDTAHAAGGNGNGICMVQQTRTDSTPPAHLLQNVNVHNNVVSGPGRSGAIADNGMHLAGRNLVYAASNVWNAPHEFDGIVTP